MPAVVTPAPLQKSHKIAVSTVAALVIVFFAALIFLASHWPFSRDVVVKDLEDESFSKVQGLRTSRNALPHPGVRSTTSFSSTIPRPGRRR